MPDLMTTTRIPVPMLCRLEFLTPKGWVSAGPDVSLLHPERYPERLREHGKFGRCTVLGDKLQPTGRVYVADDVPADPSVLVAPTDGTRVPKLPDPTQTCSVCGDEHRPPYDGRCLL